MVRQAKKPSDDFPLTFTYTDQYEVDVACGYTIPVFEQMSREYMAKHDPSVFVENELKPHYRLMFIDMFF